MASSGDDLKVYVLVPSLYTLLTWAKRAEGLGEGPGGGGGVGLGLKACNVQT